MKLNVFKNLQIISFLVLFQFISSNRILKITVFKPIKTNKFHSNENTSLQVSNETSTIVYEACDKTNTRNWNIYCSGRILESVMHHHLFSDSKTFVDKPLKYDPEIVVEKFNKQFPLNISIEEINRDLLLKFLDKNFYSEGQELEKKIPQDWQKNPLKIDRIKDKNLRDWALQLNNIWKNLCRQINPDVTKNPQRYTLLSVPNAFIIPGGRFREFYYWDAYWIIKGLLFSGMTTSAKNMIENFVYLIKKYGFVPNGGRVYYLNRSQPPLLLSMIYEYYEATHDIEYIHKVLPILEKEIEFWDKNRNVQVTMKGKKYNFYQFRAKSNVPRPESYWEDIKLVENITNSAEKIKIWQNLASAAESGWDFSSRWLKDSVTLKSIETINILPVDLNAFMCENFNIMSYLYSEIENAEKVMEYRNRYINFRRNFQKMFYVNNQSGWYDFNMREQKHNFEYYSSIAIPLFTRCYHSLNLAKSERVFQRMDEMGVFNFSGGIPTSLHNTNQQWDYPNGWSPLNHMVIEGLRISRNPRMQQKAFWLAEKWILNNYDAYQKTHSMYEKYNVVDNLNKAGIGGEYTTQSGFGWTNGVILDLLSTYSDRLKVKKDVQNNSLKSRIQNHFFEQIHIKKVSSSGQTIFSGLKILFINFCFIYLNKILL